MICYKAGSNLGCALLLGGASEKAIYLLIETYGQAIPDGTAKESFFTRTRRKIISKAFEHFKNSFKSSRNKPDGFGWTNDLETKIESVFQFCRICRNEAGHPEIEPNLSKSLLLANMAHFIKYVEDLYQLIEFYKEHEVEL